MDLLIIIDNIIQEDYFITSFEKNTIGIDPDIYKKINITYCNSKNIHNNLDNQYNYIFLGIAFNSKQQQTIIQTIKQRLNFNLDNLIKFDSTEDNLEVTKALLKFKELLNNNLTFIINRKKNSLEHIIKELPQEALFLLEKERQKIEFIAIGISTGGPETLKKLLAKLPSKSNIKILIIQHMAKAMMINYVETLKKHSNIDLKIPAHGEEVHTNCIYFAPKNKQVKIEILNNKSVFVLNDDNVENYCKPSIDYTFTSMANTFKEKGLGIIMTGIGKDGSKGALDIKESGGTVFAQSIDSCIATGMPGATLLNNSANYSLSLYQIEILLTYLMNQNK